MRVPTSVYARAGVRTRAIYEETNPHSGGQCDRKFAKVDFLKNKHHLTNTISNTKQKRKSCVCNPRVRYKV